MTTKQFLPVKSIKALVSYLESRGAVGAAVDAAVKCLYT